MKNIMFLFVALLVLIAGCAGTAPQEHEEDEHHGEAEDVQSCYEEHISEGLETALAECKEQLCAGDEHCKEEVEEEFAKL